MREIDQIKQDKEKLINHEFYKRTGLARRMYAKAGEILRELDKYSTLKSLIHYRKYNKLNRQYELCMAIGGRLLNESRKINEKEVL